MDGAPIALRLLQNRQNNNVDGTVAVIIMLFMLFCCVWTPAMLVRCWRSENEVELDSLGRRAVPAPRPARPNEIVCRMSPEERIEFIKTNLVTEKFCEIIETSTGDKTSSAHLSQSNADENMEMDNICAICLVEYDLEDEICWSHNRTLCTHHFHPECMSSWLLKHSECPCCRLPYLDEALQQIPSAADTNLLPDMRDAIENDDSPSLLRGLYLLHTLTNTSSRHERAVENSQSNDIIIDIELGPVRRNASPATSTE